LLPLAVANETTLITYLCEALPGESVSVRPPLAGGSADVRQRLVLTLLFMSAVGVERTRDLRSYTADGLARLPGRKRGYGYHSTEAFLSQLARASGAERWTEALAHWTTQLWHSPEEPSASKAALTCSIDGQRKPASTMRVFPEDWWGCCRTILRCRALVLLHDEQGHPLLATTHRGDEHLIVALPSIIALPKRPWRTRR
jgi:hypothetical protein